MATDTNKRRNIKHARCVTLDDVSMAILKNLGRGNISLGIRIAARHFADSPLSGAKLLTEAQFYNTYSQHVDIRGRDGSAEQNKESILRDGFGKSTNVNAMPASRGGRPSNVVEAKYAPKAGDTVYLIPRAWVKDGSNGLQVIEGWKPQPHEVVTITDPLRPMYEYYKDAAQA